LLLDLSTGITTVLIEPYLTSPPLTWSPDGGQFAYEHAVRRPDGKYPGEDEISIRDVGNQQGSQAGVRLRSFMVASGEWIAYLDTAGAVGVVRPDGTGATALVSLRRRLPWFTQRYFMYSPLWSPDSKSLLLNESAADDTARAMIHQFDLEQRKLQGRRGKGVAVLGWSHPVGGEVRVEVSGEFVRSEAGAVGWR
jgi:Tol biopolymer transport system component